MKRLPLPCLAALVVALTSAPALAQLKPLPTSEPKPAAAAPAASKPVTVNGKTIPRARLDYAVKMRVSQGQQDSDQLRQAVQDSLINSEILAQEAERKGLLKSGEGQVQMELVRQEAAANMAIQDYLKAHPVKDELARAEYDKIKAQRGTREYRARHILVDTEAAAKDITEKLKKGEKFEELAKQSKDPGSKDRGGDLDWASPGNYVKPFADALVKLEKGKTTDAPVQTQFGWHVIRVDDVRNVSFPAFDQVKPQILNELTRIEVQKYIQELRGKAKIE